MQDSMTALAAPLLSVQQQQQQQQQQFEEFLSSESPVRLGPPRVSFTRAGELEEDEGVVLQEEREEFCDAELRKEIKVATDVVEVPMPVPVRGPDIRYTPPTVLHLHSAFERAALAVLGTGLCITAGLRNDVWPITSIMSCNKAA
jgi:hypothetical protein